MLQTTGYRSHPELLLLPPVLPELLFKLHAYCSHLLEETGGGESPACLHYVNLGACYCSSCSQAARGLTDGGP